jgi:transposase InsO family protein
VWRTNAQLELATVAYLGWFNHRRLHSSIGNRPPVEHEHAYWEHGSRSGSNRSRLRPPQQ